MNCPFDGLLEVCVVEDNDWTFSAELKRDILEVTFGGSLHDLPTDEGRTREGNLFYTMVLADGLTDGMSIPDNEIEDTRGETNFANHVGSDESGQGGQLGGLHDDCVSGGESGADLPAHHQDCKSTDVSRCVR